MRQAYFFIKDGNPRLLENGLRCLEQLNYIIQVNQQISKCQKKDLRSFYISNSLQRHLFYSSLVHLLLSATEPVL